MKSRRICYTSNERKILPDELERADCGPLLEIIVLVREWVSFFSNVMTWTCAHSLLVVPEPRGHQVL